MEFTSAILRTNIQTLYIYEFVHSLTRANRQLISAIDHNRTHRKKLSIFID